VGVVIRRMRDGDVEAIVALSLRAWAPVFASIRETVGPQIFDYFYGGDWRGHQASDVRRACSAYQVSVAEDDGRVIGFTAINLPPEGVEGEIYMIAVDPDAQGAGVGTQLTVAAVEDIRRAGKRAAVVETGGDRAHAPARATYHKAGFTPFPSERFYLLLDGSTEYVTGKDSGISH
jgi:ribosomal protein S18 acetylase RimI-like enzyme